MVQTDALVCPGAEGSRKTSGISFISACTNNKETAGLYRRVCDEVPCSVPTGGNPRQTTPTSL